MAGEYDYSRISDFEKSQLPAGFTGDVYNMSYKWKEVFPVPDGPIKYLEIGGYHGTNVCGLMKNYAQHKDTQVHVIDPWLDYSAYPENKGQNAANFGVFLRNIGKLSSEDIQKLYIYRDFSQNVVPHFPDEHFDIIFVDGNHNPEYTLEDSVLSIRKLKSGGWLIIDDLHSPDVKKGVDSFMNAFNSYFDQAVLRPGTQLFLHKK